MSEWSIKPVGDQAILCEFGKEIDESINNQVHALTGYLKNKRIAGVTELLPTYRSLLVFYDSNQIGYEKLKKKIMQFKPPQNQASKQEKKIMIVPCLYGGEYGADLEEMAATLDMSSNRIVEIHQSVDYKVYMLGFLPGFVYLGGLDERIHIPRLDVPRTKIPARSVGIGGNQTGVYPMESPGGWRLIGRTPLDFYNPELTPPVLCSAGEYIRFVSITETEYKKLRSDVKAGNYQVEYV